MVRLYICFLLTLLTFGWVINKLADMPLTPRRKIQTIVIFEAYEQVFRPISFLAHFIFLQH